MTKNELRDRLKAGYTMDDIFLFSQGQDCLIFKEDRFCAGEEIIYIPDLFLNQIPTGTPICDDETIDDVVGHCYTGQDFIDQCEGDADLAERLFAYCDWQHPSSAIPEIDDRDEEDDIRLKIPRHLRDWTLRLCETVFDISLAAQHMLEEGEIECEDSRELFYTIFQNAVYFERQHPGPWEQENYPGDYLELVDDFAYEILIENFGKED